MSVYNHRAMVPAMGGRVAELLEGIKAEFDSVSQEMSLSKLQRDELDHKRAFCERASRARHGLC